jgi:amylosucrase
MYEQVSHSFLNEILTRLKPDIKSEDLRHFYTRLGANFYSIYSLFYLLYGDRDDFRSQAQRLVETMARQYMLRREEYRQKDLEREKDHNWFLSQKWTGMALYADGFAGDLKNLKSKARYFQDLGVNMVHVMPIMECPAVHSDGGYAVSNFREVDARFGTMEDLDRLSNELKKRDILLTLDVVLNHTSNEHEWAQKAVRGEQKYQDYYYVFPNREIPDMFEETMPEIFPDTAPGNFTWIDGMDKWVMTVFKNYQWDLNYSNPAVFIEMMGRLISSCS